MEQDDIRDTAMEEFDPLNLQYEYPSGFDVRDSYEDP